MENYTFWSTKKLQLARQMTKLKTKVIYKLDA